MQTSQAVWSAGQESWSRTAAYILFAAGMAVFMFTIVTTAGDRGVWHDEFWTLYIADPTTPLAALTSEVHPPLYYAMMRIIVAMGLKDVAALTFANIVAIAALGTLSFWLLARGGRRYTALAVIGAVMASTAVLTFALEGRNYALAQFTCLALTSAAISRFNADTRLSPWIFGLLGAACASIHVFASLYACSLAAAFVLMGLFNRDRGILITGLATGIGATLVTLLWIAIAHESLFGSSLVTWIPNDLTYTVYQFGYLIRMLAGFSPAILLLGAAIALCFFIRPTRPMVILLALTAAIFVILPTLISIKLPMLSGRYLTISAPSLLAIAGVTLITAVQSAAPKRLRMAAGITGATFFAISFVTAPANAQYVTSMRWVYDRDGARSAIDGCTSAKVRVYVPPMAGNGNLNPFDVHQASYRMALDRPAVTLENSLGPTADVSEYSCKLVGWAEHIIAFDATTVSVEDTLKWLNLTNRENVPLRIERRAHGLLLLRQ